MSTDYGYKDWSQTQYPPLAQDQTTSTPTVDQYLGDTAPGTLQYYSYSPTNKPIMNRSKMWDDNGFYMNGPSYQPWVRAKTQQDSISAMAQSWADPVQGAAVDRFMSYVNQYGHTNSSGILWGIAQLGIDPNSSITQMILQRDAEEYQRQNRESQPVRAGSPVANEGIQDPASADTFDMWAIPEFIARNGFSVLSSGMEAVQGEMRAIGGALTNEEMDFNQRIGAIVGAQMFGIIGSPLGLLINPEQADPNNPYANPWAQTDFGQTLALSRQIGFDAFTSGQAGLDVKAAEEQLVNTDPNFAGLPEEQKIALAEQYAKDNNLYSNPGWFIDETSLVGERQRRTTFNTWAIPGPDDQMTAWTLGRGIASNVVGTDSEAYSVLSGTIDAAAAILTDPLTYLPALGLPSKALAAASKGKYVIGMARQKQNNIVRAVVTNARNAQKVAAEGNLAQAQRIVYEPLREYLGRAPTQKELDDVVNGVTFSYDPTDLRHMVEADLADMTKAAREAELTSTHMSAVRIDDNEIYTYARNMRRERLEGEATQRFVNTNVVATGGTSPAVPMLSVWDRFLQYGIDNPNVTPADFVASIADDVETSTIFNETFQMWRMFAMQSRGTKTDSLMLFRDELARAAADSRSVKTGKQINPANVESDTARMLGASDAEDRLVALQDADYSGVVIDGVPTANVPVFGAHGSEAGVFYYTGNARSSLKLVDANEQIPADMRQAIVDRLMQIAEREDMRLDDELSSVIDFDSVSGQIYRRYDMGSDARGVVSTMRGDETLTYGSLLSTARMLGFDAVLDDILRTASKKNRIDGITNIADDNGIQVMGRTWLGNTDRLTGYGISDQARLLGTQVRNAVDPDSVLTTTGVGPSAVTILGNKGLSPADLDVAITTRNLSAETARRTLTSSRSDKLFAGYRQEAVLKNQLDDLNAEWADPVSKMKSVLGWHAGIRRNPIGGLTTDEKGVRSFLFGMGPMSALGSRALDVLGDFIPESQKAKALAAGPGTPEYEEVLAEAIGHLTLATNQKWKGDLYRAVAENAINGGGRAGLIDVLAPRLGVEIDPGGISKTILGGGKDGKQWVSSSRTIMPSVSRMLGQMPTARKVNLQNANDVADALVMYGRYAKIDETFLAKQVGKVMLADGSREQGIVARQAFVDVFDNISETLINNIEKSKVTKYLFNGPGGETRKKEIISSIHSATSLYLGGEYKRKLTSIGGSTSDEILATDSAVDNLMTAGETPFKMPKLILDSEIADGFIGLPPVEEWSKGLHNITLALDRKELVGDTWRTALRLYNNFFRTSLLVFRGAYLMRNLAEMQIRMYLNGHESFFTNPATMLAMTVGDEVWGRKLAKYADARHRAVISLKKELQRDPTKDEIIKRIGEAPKPPKIIQTFDMYRNTVLDTSFNTGLDAELAAANHITDFWSLIRESNALTDPRVYNAGVRQSWVPIEYGTANFTKGWANELIMLERSKVVKLLVGQKNRLQFASLVNGTATVDSQRQIVREFMHDPKHEGLRRKLIASNEEYARILDDEDATFQYLFLNENSIFNRILHMTNGDERLLNYLATGKLNYAGDLLFSPNSFTNPNKRISEFRNILDKNFTGKEWENHFKNYDVRVHYVEEGKDKTNGWEIVNQFFQISAKIERLGAVGPEFRMAYWDKIAELAPMLRGKDIPRALKAAETTLSPIVNLSGGKIGRKHAAWKSLENARNNGSDGFMKLDEIHEVAMEYAAKEITNIFYDAARRNNFWYAMRIAVPFGQAWGNTLQTWAKLGAKRPINIYKAQKLFNALQEEQSNAIYEATQQFGPLSAYGQYAPGYAPWDRDSQGGFFYQDDYGQTVFQLPLVGRALGMGTNLLARMNGVDAGPLGQANIPVASPVGSLNLALGGGESILPGFGPAVGIPLASDLMPDNKLSSWLRQQVAPFGDRDLLSNTSPAWMQKSLAGAQAIPVLGQGLSMLTSNLYPAQKNKGLIDAMTILAATGNYPDLHTNPLTAQRFKTDSQELAAATLMLTGMFQNVLPSTPMPEGAATFTVGEGESQTTSQYTIGLVNSLYQQYYVNNGFDSTAAREEIIKDFGPYAVFALVGNWSGYSRLPTSQALEWAYNNPKIAEANPDIFPLFFPQGDTSSVEALRWLRYNTFGERQRKNPDEAFSEAVTFLKRVQTARINSMEMAGTITSDQASAARDEVEKTYMSSTEASGTFLDKTKYLEQINYFVQNTPEVQGSEAATAFMIAWDMRDQALKHVRALSGDENAGLGSDQAEPVRNTYNMQLEQLVQQYPDFKILGSYLRKEWE